MPANPATASLLNRPAVEYAALILSGILYACALKYFVLPTEVILTGTEGIASALSYYFESSWLFIGLYVLFQTGLLIFAYRRVSHRFAIRSLLVVASVVIGLAVLPQLRFADPKPENERILLVLFGGLLAGAAKSLAFRFRGSTGDEDILGAYLAMRYLKPVGYIAILAAIVSTTFGLAMNLLKNGAFESMVNTLMYTCIYIFASAETLNNLYKKFKLTLFTIVTSRADAVGQAIKKTSDHRTFSVQEGKGGHSGRSLQIVHTIVTREELPEIVAAVEQADPDGFYYYHDIVGVSRRYYIEPIG